MQPNTATIETQGEIKPTTLPELALQYLAGGVSLVPCSSQTKRPEDTLLPRDAKGKPVWGPYQDKPPEAEVVRGWFDKGCRSVAAVCGRVSGGLVVIDFDEARFYDAWREQVGTLADGLPVQRTGRDGGGYQVYFRCPEPGKSEKLAWVSDDAEENGRKCAVETKGEGGYAILPGSLHPSGRRYEAIGGDFASIPTVPQAVADALLAAARKLDEAPQTRQQMEARQRAANTSDKYRREANGQASVIDAYNAQTTIEAELRGRRYTQHGDRWKRPGGKSLSVTVNDGRSFHHSANDPLNDGYWHRPFDVFCALEHGGGCKAAVRAAAEQLGIASRQQPDSTEPRDDPRKEFRRITCSELDAGDYRLEYLIDNTLVAGQPCIVAGGKKCLKTSILLDMGIALATGGSLLGRLRVNRRCRVGIMTGESGLATIQETCRRICKAAGYRLADIDGLFFSEDLPRFGNVAHEEALRRFIENDKLEVVVIDPAYLCLPGADAGNLFAQGELLRGMSQVCNDTRCMMVLAHHTRKNKADPFNPPELEDIAWAGFQEFARQWLLVGRREPYEPGSGEHRLWLSVGGSAGHTALWAVSIDEGTRETEGGRFWQVDVHPASQAREDVKTREIQAKALSQQAKLDADKARLTAAMSHQRFVAGATERELRAAIGVSGDRIKIVLSAMQQDGTIEPCDVMQPNRKKPYSGFRLIGSASEQPEMPGFDQD